MIWWVNKNMAWWPFSKPAGTKQQAGLTISQQLGKAGGLSSDFILSAIEDGVVIVGRDNVIHLFNPAASKLTGWPAAEAVGLNFSSVINVADEHGNAYQASEHPFMKALTSGQVIKDSRGTLVTKSGKKVPVSMIVSPVNEADGQPAKSVVGVMRDVTAEKAEENRRSEFISTASHEMRTPIAAIEGYLSLALNEKVSSIDDRARSYLKKAHDATKHLGELFQDLLTSSRAEDGRIASYPQVVELGEIVQQLSDTARFTAQQKGLELKFVIGQPPGIKGDKVIRPLFYCNVDPNRLREVIQNLIDNAVKYTMEGSITVSITGDSSVVQIQVRDTGSGIPEEDIPHLFQKFYRVDSSMTRTVGGTGLGLYIAKKIVELYNGRIWVESQLGKGSTFYVNLPRLTSEQALKLQQRQANLIQPIDKLGG